MRDYFITYNGDKTVTITDIDAAHARETLQRVIPGVKVINTTVIIPKPKKDGTSKRNTSARKKKSSK